MILYHDQAIAINLEIQIATEQEKVLALIDERDQLAAAILDATEAAPPMERELAHRLRTAEKRLSDHAETITGLQTDLYLENRKPKFELPVDDQD